MNLLDFPTFEAARERMRDFLALNGLSQEIVWVATQYVCVYRNTMYVRHDSLKSEAQLRAIYELAGQNGLGVRISAWCTAGSAVVCTVWYPKDEYQAEYAQQSRGLKLSNNTDMRQAVLVRSRLRWVLLKCLSQFASGNRASDWECQ